MGHKNTKPQELASVIFYICGVILIFAGITIHLLYTINRLDIGSSQHLIYVASIIGATAVAFLISFYLFTKMIFAAIPLSLLITGLVAGLAYIAIDACAALL